MTIRRTALQATIVAVALLTFSASAPGARASAPPASAPPISEPDKKGQDNGDKGKDGKPIEESWALSPTGSIEQGGNRSDLSYDADPGGVVKDSVTLFNFGTQTLTFRLYATDAYNDEAGQFALLAGDKKPKDVGTWVKLDVEALTVLPGKQTTIPITIKIPADASPGDHVGAVLASSATLGNATDKQVITVDRRTGSRLYVRVNGKLVRNLAIDTIKTEYRHAFNPGGGSAKVSFHVSNRGNVRLSGTPTVSVSGPFGLFAQKLTLPEMSDMLPGEDFVVSTDVADAPAALLDYTTVRYDLHGVGDASGGAKPSAKVSMFAPPITLLGVLLVVVLALLIRRRRRHRRNGRLAPNPGTGVSRLRESV